MNESVWKTKLVILYLGDKDKTQLLGGGKETQRPLQTASLYCEQ